MATPIPQNRAAFSFAEIIQATGALPNAVAACDLSKAVRGVSTDSREALSGKLFVALRGEHFDGNRFVDAAFTAGAAAVLLESDSEARPDSARALFTVPSSLDALGGLARLHRRRWGGTVIAVAGSAGKTTTKSAIGALLDTWIETGSHTSPGNLNNQIGVPMVLFGLMPEQRFAVVEIGTNVRGEVAKLAAIAEPDVAVLTLVAMEHAAGIGSIDEIEAEEGDLLAHPSVKRAAVVNGDDARAYRQLRRAQSARTITFGFSEACDYRIVERKFLGSDGSRFSFRRPRTNSNSEAVSITTTLVGDPGVLATLAAIAVAESVRGEPVPASVLERAFSQPNIGEAGRLRPMELGDGTLLLDDSYNANPGSVRAAIEVARRFAEQRSARLVLILGEMRELGDFSEAEHRALAEPVKASGAALLIAVAGDASRLADASQKLGLDVEFVSNAEQALSVCRRLLAARDVVLIKGSRGIKLDVVVEALAAERGRAR